MASLDWSYTDLTDSELEERFNNLPPDAEYTEVDLSRNRLNTVPDFTRYRQFDNVKTLVLHNNSIKLLHTEKLPPNIQELDMSRNQITEVGDLSPHRQLHTLYLYNNKLTVIDASKLPVSVQKLDMSNNQITEVGDLSPHQHLRALDLSRNKLTVIDASKLPVGVQELYMSENQITEVCDLSPHRHLRALSLSHNKLTVIDASKLPVGVQELYMSNNQITEVGDLSPHRHLHTLVLTGNEITRIDTGNTKLSFWKINTLGESFFDNDCGYNHLKSCGFNTAHLHQPPEQVFKRGFHSVQAYYKDIKLSKKVKHSRNRLVLLGLTKAGKTSMVESLIAGRAVLVDIKDRTQVLNLKYWNITKDDIVNIFDHGGHAIYSITSPLFISKESLIFLVHDITKIQKDDIEPTTEILRQTLHQYPKNEMYIVLTHTDELANTEAITIHSKLIMCAIRQFFDEEISGLRRLLTNKKALNENQRLIEETDKLLKVFSEKKSSLQLFCVSSADYSGMEKVKGFLTEKVEVKRTTVPESWVTLYRKSTESKKKYLMKSEFTALQSSNDNRSDVSVPLRYFADTNLFLYYEDNPDLNEFVFQDIDFLVTLFQSLFHHNIAEVIDFEADEHVSRFFKHKAECDLAIQRYQREGLVDRKLLSLLWSRCGLPLEDKDIFITLMQSFDLCHSISKDYDLQFFPWFVESQVCPPSVDVDHVTTFDKRHVSLHLQCEFFNRIPLNVFEMISVSLQRKATQESHYYGDRYAWHDGLSISFGSVECVVTRSRKHSTINICLHGEVDDLPHVWKNMESLLDKVVSTLNQWFGVIQSIHFVCGHCAILGLSPAHHWLPELVVPKEDVAIPRFVRCPRGNKKDVPAALIMAVFKDEDTKEVQSKTKQDVTNYLDRYWKARKPPQRPPYLDVEQTEPEVFKLKWGLPDVESGGVPITRSVLEVKEAEGGEWKRLADLSQGTGHTFKGSAVEFQVAVKNCHGIGPFIRTRPKVNISDENLLPSDRMGIQNSEELFCQMSSVKKVVIRLCDRGVLHRDAGERILTCLEQRGSQKAAKKLMDEICRCTYKQLYLFKKTLEELNLETLAHLVPIRQTDDPALGTEFYDLPPVYREAFGPTPLVHHQPDMSGEGDTQSSETLSRRGPSSGSQSSTAHLHLREGEGTLVYIRSMEPNSRSVMSEQHQTGLQSERIPANNGRLAETRFPPDQPVGEHPVDTVGPHPSLSAVGPYPPSSDVQQTLPQLSRNDLDTGSGVSQPYNLLDKLTVDQKNSRPNDKLFGIIAPRVENVDVFGLNLGFKRKQVEHFKQENPDSVQSQTLQMLYSWRQKKKVKVTVERLVKALQKSNIAEQSYRQLVLDFLTESDAETDTEDSGED